MELLTATFAIVGMVIIIAALLSGAIEKKRIPQVAVFILIGAILGPSGLKLLDVDLNSPLLRAVAVLSLVLVLFTDAVSLNIREVKSNAKLAFMILGPGTLLIAFLIGLAAWQLLELPLPAAFLLGAALASTDPVMLRGLIRNPNLPEPAKQGLRLESGLNDVFLLPIVLICMAFLKTNGLSGNELVQLGVHLFLLGPGAGIVVGLFSIGVLELIRKKIGIRRDYESLYSLGIAFLAYAAAEAVHGSGFLSAFAAGMVITLLDVELCDCFLEYGETTAEMALLFTFVLFGTSLIWQGLSGLSFQIALFAIGVILIRPVVLLGTLWGLGLDLRSKLLIAWFGPRGLSTLLLMLLPIFAGTPGVEPLFAICCFVVLISVLLHGGSQMFFGSSVKMEKTSESNEDVVITVERMLDFKKNGEDVIVLDVRKESALDGLQARHAIRISPDHAVEEVTAKGPPKEAWLIAFCA
ncbi:cation:proton antiporter [bacterium]|nr:cation:proton antiporter [bacterium]